MTETEGAKRRRGGQPKPPAERKRNNLTFRARDRLRTDLEKAAAAAQRSVSEEIEHRLNAWTHIDQLRAEAEQRLSEARQFVREANAIREAAHVQAIRDAGFSILREIEGSPSRVIISTERLLAECGSVFIPEEPVAPAQNIPAETEAEIAMARRMAADAVKPSPADDDEAA
jgi:hypothetical protein